jgi:hypothetical protein
MGGTEFWLCSNEETSVASDNTAITVTSSPDSSDAQDICADGTATLEHTLLTLFNDMVESIGGIPDVDVEPSPSSSDAPAFDPSEAMASLSSLTWLEGISL